MALDVWRWVLYGGTAPAQLVGTGESRHRARHTHGWLNETRYIRPLRALDLVFESEMGAIDDSEMKRALGCHRI